MKIASRRVSVTEPCLIVAEIGLNHNGDPALAHRMIDVAIDCGADAVKFQKRETEALLTRAGRAMPYTGPNSYGATYGEHRTALELNAETWAELARHTRDRDRLFIGSAFDVPSLLHIAPMVDAIKIPSCDLTHRDLLRTALQAANPIILSTGMATQAELDRAVDTLSPARTERRLMLLHCVSAYPLENRDANLWRLLWLSRYAVPIGYSGHERGLAVSVAAVALGACLVERHFTLDRAAKGPDHAASLEPEGFRRLVRDIRNVEAAIDGSREQPLPCELPSRRKLRKSTVAARWLPAGHILASGDIAWKSPEVDGAAPPDLDICGRALRMAVDRDEPLMLTNLMAPTE